MKPDISKVTMMQLEINYEPSNEEVTMVLDDVYVLKASLGDRNTLVLNSAFRDIEEENPDLYTALRKISLLLLELQDV